MSIGDLDISEMDFYYLGELNQAWYALQSQQSTLSILEQYGGNLR